MTLRQSREDYFYSCAREVLEHEKVLQMSEFPQHGGVSCLEHSIAVARLSYFFCARLRLDVDHRSLIRGALLHDFFLYDWHCQSGGKWWQKHGFSHPRQALQNAGAYFDLNRKEKNIILRHMWPLTVIPPASREAAIVSLMDKYCAIKETIAHGKALLWQWVGA